MGALVSADERPEMMTAHCTSRARHRERGTALIEFTLVLPMLLILTVAAVDFGRAFFVKNVVEQAAREGVRTRAVYTAADSALVTARVNTVAGASNVAIKSIQVTGPDANRQVHVVVTADFNWIFPGVFNLFGANFTNPMPLKGEAWMRSEGNS
jgi:Flp pilus assembly protein TadG